MKKTKGGIQRLSGVWGLALWTHISGVPGVVASSKAIGCVKSTKEPVSGREGLIPAKDLGL